MTICHHPSDQTLLAHANGSLASALSQVVVKHLEGCAACRHGMSLAEAVGGALLENVAPAPMSADALARTLARLDMPETPQKHVSLEKPGVRRWLAPGIWVRPLRKDRADGTRLYLIGAAAGKSLPRHDHHGLELTQVLSGEFFDGALRYGPGDLLEAEGGHEHRPRVGDGEECVCLIASHGLPKGLPGFLMRVLT